MGCQREIRKKKLTINLVKLSLRQILEFCGNTTRLIKSAIIVSEHSMRKISWRLQCFDRIGMNFRAGALFSRSNLLFDFIQLLLGASFREIEGIFARVDRFEISVFSHDKSYLIKLIVTKFLMKSLKSALYHFTINLATNSRALKTIEWKMNKRDARLHKKFTIRLISHKIFLLKMIRYYETSCVHELCVENHSDLKSCC